MPYERLSAATVEPGLLAMQACTLAGWNGSTAATTREDTVSRLAEAQEVIKIKMMAHRGSSRAMHQFAGGLRALEADNSTAENQDVRFKVVRLSGRLLRGLDADAGTGSCPLPTMLERFTEALQTYAHRLPPERTRAFTLQLHSLLANEEEFREARVYPLMASFKGLVELLRLNPAFKHPNLSIDGKGRFVASWAPHSRAKLTLTFAGVTGGTWIASDRSPGMKERASGAFSIPNVGSIPDSFALWMNA